MASRQIFDDIKIRLISDIILILLLCNRIQCNPENSHTSKITPDRLKYELQQLLNIHKQREPHEKRPSVESLYQSIISDIEMEKLVKLDIFVRGLATLKAGESCDPVKQDLLDRPPLTVKFGDPNPDAILDWQRSLLLNRDPMCDYFNFLQCHPDTQTCCCKEGLVLHNGRCVLEIGDNCESDYYFKSYYFDAFKNVKYLVPDPSPHCQPGTTCQKRPLFFRKKCWCDELRTREGSCDETSIFPPELTYSSLKDKVTSLFSLQLDDECDPEFQRVIFDPPEYDLTDTRTRIEKYKSILEFPLLKLCDISRHLNCSEDTRRCTCWDSLVFQPEIGTCNAIRANPCGQTSLMDEFHPGGPRIWHLQRVFAKNLASTCVPGAKCSGLEGTPKKCQCITNFGDLCRFPGSIFTQLLHQPTIWTSTICEQEIYNVFDQVNKNMLKLQKQMILQRTEDCKAGEGLEEYQVDNIMKFWQDLGHRWGSGVTPPEKIECKDMLLRLNEISEKASKLAQSGFFFCDRTRGLCCGDNSKKCVCLKGTTWQDGRCRLLAGQLCDRWNLHVPRDTPCVLYSNCRPIRDGRHVCQCLNGPGPICRSPIIEPDETECPESTIRQEEKCRISVGELCDRWNHNVPPGTPCVLNADCLPQNGQRTCQCPTGPGPLCQDGVCPMGTTLQEGKCRIIVGELCDRWNHNVPPGTPCVLNADCLPQNGQRTCQCPTGPGPLCQDGVCPMGTTLQEGKCRIIVGELCDRWNHNVPSGTPCVLNADCLPQNGQRTCQCPTGPGPLCQNVVCPMGTTLQEGKCRIIVGELCDRWNTNVPAGTPCVLNAVCRTGESGRHYCQCLSGPGPLCGNSTDLEDTTDEPRAGVNKTVKNRSPSPADQAILNELQDILVELSLDRVVGNESTCISTPNDEFLNIAKIFSKSNKEKTLIENATDMLHTLTQVFKHGYHVCDVQKFLMCSEFAEICICEDGLVINGPQDCAVGPGQKCNITTKVYDLKELYILPEAPCVPGYTCLPQPHNGTTNSTNNQDINNTICIPDPHNVTKSGARPGLHAKSFLTAAFILLARAINTII